MSRWNYFLRRILLAIPVLLFSTSITFLIIRAGPINPVDAIIGSPQGAAAQQARLDVAVSLGIRYPNGEPVPLWRQYIDFMTDLLTLDLGQTWVINSGTPVWEAIGARAPRTIWLGFWSVLIAIFIGIPLGFYAGLNPNTWSDYTASFGGIVWRAMPNFWLAVILASTLSQTGEWFNWVVPLADSTCKANSWLFTLREGQCRLIFGWQSWIVETNVVTSPSLTNLQKPENLGAAIKQIMPPALVLGSSSMGNEMRIGRTAVLETVNSNYVETARAKGVPPRLIVWKHVFRNALIPLVPIITGEAFLLIGGSVLVETVFAINGIGKLFFDSVVQGDLPLAGSLVFFFIMLTLSINILQDLLYTIIDPRVGYQDA